jgi:hypothetical protein
MKHYNCRCNPGQWDKIAEAVHEWAKAKGVDPEHVFAANEWSESKYAQFRSDINALRCEPPLMVIVQGKINTSIFEEAIIIE